VTGQIPGDETEKGINAWPWRDKMAMETCYVLGYASLIKYLTD